MIATILAWVAGLGLPAVLTGILGKFLPGLFAGTIGKFLGPIVALCMGLVDVLLLLLRWIMQKLINGLDHIVKSVPATLTVLVLMYGSYVYGIGIDSFWKGDTPAVESRPAPTQPRTTTQPATPGDWIRDFLGGL